MNGVTPTPCGVGKHIEPTTSPELVILHADEALVIVDKPSGLLSVPGKSVRDSAEKRVQARFPRARLVHRLDQATSGLLIFALGYENQVALQRQFSERQVGKRYMAIVDGQPEPGEGIIEMPLICDWPNRPRQKVCYESGKPSATKYRCLRYDPETDTSRVALFPITGRSHQLRVHMQQLGHPIVGDTLYASAPVRDKSSRLLLHATRLEFHHPETGQPFEIESPPPF